MRARFLTSINDISEADWSALWPGDYPFSRYPFLAALESSASVSAQTGWKPCHLIIYTPGGRAVCAMLLYEKNHSYGEYVFDWGLADAYQRAGFDYYPKLLNAIPFTPASGPRLGFVAGLDETHKQEIITFLLASLKEKLREIHGSSFHSLFPLAEQRTLFEKHKLIQRQGCQFHWFNNHFKNFDDFLARMSSRKRKNVRRERQKISEQNIVLQMRKANQVPGEQWQLFYALYHRTYFKRSGRQGYLNEQFFNAIRENMPEQVLLASAHEKDLNGEMIAGALYFRDASTLYGRYWGTRMDLDGLHFETCYYQGIDYAIAQGLQRFDPGAQGEHKIQRGFTPVLTCSYHYIHQPEFRAAINDFASRERQENMRYCEDARNYLPFREDQPVVDKEYLL